MSQIGVFITWFHSTHDFFPFHSTEEVSSNILGEPTLTSKKEDLGVESDQLELECTVTVASMTNRIEIKWELPNENIAKKVSNLCQNAKCFSQINVR